MPPASQRQPMLGGRAKALLAKVRVSWGTDLGRGRGRLEIMVTMIHEEPWHHQRKLTGHLAVTGTSAATADRGGRKAALSRGPACLCQTHV